MELCSVDGRGDGSLKAKMLQSETEEAKAAWMQKLRKSL
jgi:hypothetical protein